MAMLASRSGRTSIAPVRMACWRWLAGNRHQPLSWSDAPTDTEQSFSSSDSLMSDLMSIVVGGIQHLDEHTLWPVLVDPTSFSDPNSGKTGPEL